MKEIRVELASVNPNVNGYYYEETSYKRAMKDYIENGDKLVYNSYDSSNHLFVGYLLEYNMDEKYAIISVKDECDMELIKDMALGTSLYADASSIITNDRGIIIQEVKYVVLSPRHLSVISEDLL